MLPWLFRNKCSHTLVVCPPPPSLLQTLTTETCTWTAVIIWLFSTVSEPIQIQQVSTFSVGKSVMNVTKLCEAWWKFGLAWVCSGAPSECPAGNFTAFYFSEWKKNFLKIKKLVLIGGPDDGVITPWQSRWVRLHVSTSSSYLRAKWFYKVPPYAVR